MVSKFVAKFRKENDYSDDYNYSSKKKNGKSGKGEESSTMQNTAKISKNPFTQRKCTACHRAAHAQPTQKYPSLQHDPDSTQSHASSTSSHHHTSQPTQPGTHSH